MAFSPPDGTGRWWTACLISKNKKPNPQKPTSSLSPFPSNRFPGIAHPPPGVNLGVMRDGLTTLFENHYKRCIPQPAHPRRLESPPAPTSSPVAQADRLSTVGAFNFYSAPPPPLCDPGLLVRRPPHAPLSPDPFPSCPVLAITMPER